jgi:predicted metal-dependent peptidase
MFTTAELTAEQRITKAVAKIMANPRYVALSGLLMVGKREVKDGLPTACTNGRDEFYGRDFVASLTDPELRFLILHENYHKIYKHLTTWNYLFKENGSLANQACDYVINLQIDDENKDGFAKMPVDKQTGERMGLLDEQFRGMDTLQVFKILKQEQEQQGGSGEGEGEGGGLDDHDWEGAQSMSENEQKQLANDIDQAIRQGLINAGKTGSGGNRTLEALVKPEVDWREVLREFITATCKGSDYSTYARPNRRYMSAGIYMPSGVSEQVGELVIAIDTSGSIGGSELTRFLSEVKGITDTVKPDSVRVLYWDTKVCADEQYGGTGKPLDGLVTSTKPAGGGGTDVTCVPRYMQEEQIKAQAVIVLTDGYLGGDWGTWTTPLLWCIVDNKRAKPSVGKYVHVKL